MALLAKMHQDLEEHYIMETSPETRGILSKVNPVISLLSTIWLLILINYLTYSQNKRIELGIGIFILGIVLLKDPFRKRYIKTVAVLGVLFPLVISLPLLFMHPNGTINLSDVFSLSIFREISLPINTSGLEEFLVIYSRVFASVSLTLLFSFSSSFFEVIGSLQKLHVPEPFIINLVLTYRYVFLFFGILTNTLRAEACRRGNARYKFKERFKHLGTIFGGLLLRSIHRGERLYMAMQARGYDSKFMISQVKYDKRINILYGLIISIITLAILLG